MSETRREPSLAPSDTPLPGGAGSNYRAADFGLPETVACPFCEQEDSELHNPFGSQLSVATYWCFACHTAFEWLKWEGPGG